jgi:leucyl aminopeptidase
MQPTATINWLGAMGIKGDAEKFALLPDESGALRKVLVVLANEPDLWALAHLPTALPSGNYKIAEKKGISDAQLADMALGWQLGSYRFDCYKKTPGKKLATLVLPKTLDLAAVLAMAEGIFLARDLINRPANDLTPYALAETATALAKQHGGTCKVIKDEALLTQNYPLVHAVGRASDNRPCLADLRWGNSEHPKVTLVGKGIAFDSGGLDIKPSSGMLLMKKDMGGAANVLALAHAIMAAKLPVCLRVLIPAAENSVSGNAFRPKDVIKSRKGITVEIGNTDAEGRLVLCDALAEADTEKPELLIDFATLTGAARVALGTDMPAFFTNDDRLAAEIANASETQKDPLWRLPLWQPYREQLDSDVADINNAGSGGFGGAITAALYLKEFIEHCKSWVHVDLMAWNLKTRAGRPMGGEVMGVRAIFHLLAKRYGNAD